MSVERARGFRSAAILFGCLCLLAAIFYSPLLDLISTPAAAAQSGQAINLRAEVDLVTVPVVALDKKGKPVTNLTKDSFQLYEDGKKQEILSFDAVTEEPAGPSSLNAPVIENAESSHGKIVFIVFDDSTIKTANIKKARDSAETFVSQHMKPGDLFAVASYGYGMKLLQNFTNDSDKVSKAIAQPAVSTANSSSSPGGYVDGSLPQFGRQRDLDPTNTSLKYQAEGLLKALQAINASIERIRGQKSVLVFSESSFLDPNTAQKVLPEVLTSAKRSGVVYYTVDPGGLKSIASGPTMDADASTGSAGGGRSRGQALSAAPEAGSAMSLLKNLATGTGGTCIYNTNNYDGELADLYRQLSNYYILGFTSNNPMRNGDLRKLEVKVDLKGVTLKYRTSYLDRRPLDVLGSSRQEGKLMDALASPTPATQLPIVFRPAYFYDSPQVSRVMVFCKIGMEKVQIKKKGDQLEGDVNVMGLAYAEDGSIAGRFSEPVHVRLDKAQDAVGKSLAYHNYFKLQPGTYRVKLAVSDEANNLGSTEQSLKVPAEAEHGLAVSSVVVAAQLSALPDLVQNIQARLLDDSNPLVYKGMQVVPSVDNRMRVGSQIPILFKIYKPEGDSSPWKLQAKPKLVSEKGEEISQPGIDLGNSIVVVGKSEVVVGLPLSFPSAKAGKYRLLVETTNAGSAEAATAQTDIELVQ